MQYVDFLSPTHSTPSSVVATFKKYADTLLLDPSDPYYKWELRWLNRPDTIPRYMRAAKWKLPDAKRRIEGTIKWRREFQPELIRPDEVCVYST